MKTRTLVLLACFVSALAFGVAVAADNGPETAKIDNNGKGKSVKAFPHKKHQELPALKGKCNTCHHKAKAGEKPKKCAACHTDVKEKDPKTGAIGFKKAYHDVCQKCHKKQKDKPELKKCKTCHPK